MANLVSAASSLIDAKKRPDLSQSRNRWLGMSDRVFKAITFLAAWTVVGLICWIGYRLFVDSALSRKASGIGFLTIAKWDEVHQIYGALPFIYGTVVTSILALLISAPIGVGCAAFMSEICPKKLSNFLSFFIELLAAVPSIIYGLWGFLILCPFLQVHINGWLSTKFASIPLFGGPPIMTNMLAAGIVLAIMVLPFIASISFQILRSIPRGQRDAAIGLGATKWETIKEVILPEAKSGITGAVILAFGRAVGETMAVVLVIGNTVQIKESLLLPAYTMPSLLANQSNEAFNQPLQRSALLEIALLLFAITLVVNGLARYLLLSSQKILAAKKSTSNSVLKHEKLQKFYRILVWLVVALLVISFTQADLKARGIKALLGMGPFTAIAILAGFIISDRMRSSVHLELWRNWVGKAWSAILSACTILALLALGSLFFFVATKGFHGLNMNLFTKLPGDPTDATTGIKNSIVGTLVLIAIAGGIGTPIGLLGGIYLSEFAQGTVGHFVRFCADVLNGIPSVVVGLFAYAAFVLPTGKFSAWAGGGALAIMMIPTVVRTTEEMLKLVPQEFRDASLGLGSTKVQTICHVVIPSAMRGIATGVMLAVARIAGETAPLLFTAFGNDQLVVNPNKPISSLTLVIYKYAQSAYDVWISQAWAGALILLAIILVLSVIARVATKGKFAPS